MVIKIWKLEIYFNCFDENDVVDDFYGNEFEYLVCKFGVWVYLWGFDLYLVVFRVWLCRWKGLLNI